MHHGKAVSFCPAQAQTTSMESQQEKVSDVMQAAAELSGMVNIAALCSKLDTDAARCTEKAVVQVPGW
jgi:hypothetical protein